MYQHQLNFALFVVTSALGISWQHLNHTNLLVRSVYRFYVNFHVRLMLHELGISLSHEDGFIKIKNAYIKSAYYSIMISTALMKMKYGFMGIGFIQRIMLFLVMKQRLRKDLHQITLCDGYLHNLKVLQENTLKK